MSIRNVLFMTLGVICILSSIILFKFEDIKAYFISESNKKVEACYFDKNCKDVDLNALESYAVSESSGLDIKKITIRGDKLGDRDKSVKGANTITDTTSNHTPDGGLAGEGVLGMFYADKINLVEPIYQGASQANMAKGLATVGSKETLDENNVAIAGHRAWGVGVRFNRLGELNIGDEIRVKTYDSTSTYRVYKKFKVKPSDVGVLDETSSKEMTLITCESYDDLTGNFADRLILKLNKV